MSIGTSTLNHKLLTPRSVAKMLSCSTRTVYKLAQSGHLTGLKVGASLRIEAGSLEKYVKNQIEEYQLKNEIDGNAEIRDTGDSKN